jgi:hypothetical protein
MGTLALCVVLAVLVAIMTCGPAAFGAVYTPDDEIVPTVLFPPLIPSTAQVTAVLTTPLMEAWNCAVCPGVAEACTGEIVTVLLGCVPVPFSVTVCSVEGSVSEKVTKPARDPAAEGVNVTCKVHFAAAANDAPQLLVCA